MRKVLSLMAAAAACGLSAPALASDLLWLDSDNTPYNNGDTSNGSLLFSAAGVNVRVSAWSIHDNGNIYSAQLGVWSAGLGVTNGSGDNSHTVDNSGYLDFLLFQFDQVVELDMARFNTGWHSMNDTDATIGYDTTNLAYTTLPSWNGGPQSQLSALDFYSSNASGSGTGNSGNSYRDINPSDRTGNMWIIAASFDNPTEYRYKKLDGFKLEKLTFTRPPPGVPEPSTWAMLLVGFFGLGGALRSAKRRELARGTKAFSAA